MDPAPIARSNGHRALQQRRLRSMSVRPLQLGLIVVAVGTLTLVGALGAFGLGGRPDPSYLAGSLTAEPPVSVAPPFREPSHPDWCTGPVVAGVVTDGFRVPPQPWSAGNRGWTIATDAGEPVRAAADGVVTFAGAVAHRLYVTILHAGGLRTSYSYLAQIEVQEGDLVTRGRVVGTTASVFHLGLRDGDTYLDPALLIRWRCPWHAVLVPLEG